MQNEDLNQIDAQILAEFERLVLGGHNREKAERLVCNLYGRTALGTSGRTRAAIHELVSKSTVRHRQPKKEEAKAETKADIQAGETEAEAETKGEIEMKAEVKGEAETVTELATEAFNAEGIWEPDEGSYNLLVEALKNFRNAGAPLDIDVASEILQAILAGEPHPALPAVQAEATTIVTLEAPAFSPVTETEAVELPTLVKLEAEVEKAWARVEESSWQWAVALCAIHDSKLFPDSASAGSWERYCDGRWKENWIISDPKAKNKAEQEKFLGDLKTFVANVWMAIHPKGGKIIDLPHLPADDGIAKPG
jgi:hypothetical protein